MRVRRRKREGFWFRCMTILSVCCVFAFSAVLYFYFVAPVSSQEDTSISDTSTPPRPSVAGASSWELTLVNASSPLPEGFSPPLSSIDSRGLQFDSRAISFLQELLSAMRDEGLSPLVCSAYRPAETQKRLFAQETASFVEQGLSSSQAVEAAKQAVAYPGTSEHELGLAVDIVAIDHQTLDDSYAQTPEAKWLREHCAEYGFILRYPSGKSEITGVIFEPWHFRYVGREAAVQIMSQGITLEEYLSSSS